MNAASSKPAAAVLPCNEASTLPLCLDVKAPEANPRVAIRLADEFHHGFALDFLERLREESSQAFAIFCRGV